MNNVVVFAVHPDDETLGAGGTILRHIAAGDDVHWVILTEPSSLPGVSEDFLKSRKEQIEKVTALYGFKSVIEMEWPTTKIEELPKGDLIGKISEFLIFPIILWINLRPPPE